MIASSWLDPVLGVDIHWEMVPTPAPVPTPIPNPFVGIVFDPGGLIGSAVMSAAMSAVFGAPFQGPVLHCVFPMTNTGTEAKHIPGHIIIPPGTIWAPVPRTPKPKVHPGDKPSVAPPVKPENDAVCILGSKTVEIGGSNAVRLGDILLSCSEPVRLPSSVVLAIPKGAPVLIGGPPSLDIASAVMASLRTRFVSDSLHALMSRIPFRRLRNLARRAVCFFTGHPVDVASGKVMTSSVDADLPGPLPLKIERVYSSAFGERAGALGRGWSLSLDQGIWTERGKVVLLEEDGREVEFDTFDLAEHRMRPGDEVWQPMERLTLRCLEHGRWQVVAHDGVTREFAPVPGRTDGRAMIQRARSRCGFHEILYQYDKGGRLEWVRDACGRLIWLESDREGRVTALKLPVPSGDGWYVHRKYAYDRGGDLVQVTDALKHTWRFEYVTHLLVRETDRTGLSFHFEYDGLGEDAWCTRTWGDGGIYDHTLAYDKVKKVTFVTNSLGHTTQYHMNLVGQVVKVVDPLQAETKYEYDPRTLQKTAEIDALGHARRWEYDARGNCTKTIEPDGATIAVRYDVQDRPVEVVEPCGGSWSWEYAGASGLVTRERDPNGQIAEYAWDRGRLRSLTSAGRTTSFRYDEKGNLAVILDADGGRIGLEHDALGRAVRVKDPRGAEQILQYDAQGQATTSRESDGNVRRFSYDPEGNLLGVEDALRREHYSYVGFHRLARRQEEGAGVSFEWDTEERLVGLRNELSQVHRFMFDACGRVVEEVGIDGGTRRFERDRAGRVVVETRPSGAATRFERDAAGRVVAVVYSDGARETFGYRADGALEWAANEIGRVVLDRDRLGNVVRETQGDVVLESRYDPRGYRHTIESSLGTRTVITRSPMGAVTRLAVDGAQPGEWVAHFDRDSLGTETGRSMPGEVAISWRRDVTGRPASRRVTTAGRVATDLAYEWSVGWQLDGVRDGTGVTRRYRHDGRGQLVGMESSDGSHERRSVDPVGNVYRAPGLDDREYEPGGWIRRTDHGQYFKDGDGNLVEKRSSDGSIWRYAWDGAGRLREVTRPDGSSVEFTYDALGRRVSKRTSLSETRFVWDGDLMIHELGPGAGLTRWYYDPETFSPVAKEAAGTYYSVVTDHLGTPTELYDEKGCLAWRMQLDLYGAGRPDEQATSCALRWPGQYHDLETGLHYNRFRYYDPEIGMYISPDPLGIEGGTRPYAYVPDPLCWVDPLGLINLRSLSDGDLLQRIDDLMFRNKRLAGGGGTHGLIHRIREQILGAMRPGSPGWASHEAVIRQQQQALREALEELEKRGFQSPRNAWSLATRRPPTGRETEVPRDCR